MHTSATASEWSLPPETPALERDEVHVWRASLGQPGTRVDELFAVLDHGERERAGRFRFRKDRKHFIVARGILRTLLGRYLGSHPAAVTFAYSPFGKPSLARQSGEHPVRFNLSHSHGLALYAFTRSREVGVDVEFARADFASEEIAERFFSAPEVAALRALEPHLKTEAFFNCWTRKEAYIKAIGEGLSHLLDRFAVSLAPGEAALLFADGGPEELARWSLQDLKPAPGYAAALAVEKPGWRLKCYDWPDGAPPARPNIVVA